MGDDITMKFRQKLLLIDDNLGTEDVAALKFLCVDLISFKKLESAQSALDIFQLLMAEEYLNEEDTFLLAELLYRIKCHFLLQKLNYTKERVQEFLPEKGRVSPYRQMLYELAENITSEMLKEIIFLLRDHLPKRQPIISALELLILLEKQGLLTESNVKMLEKICTTVSPDLLETINSYKREKVSLPQQENTLPVKESARPGSTKVFSSPQAPNKNDENEKLHAFCMLSNKPLILSTARGHLGMNSDSPPLVLKGSFGSETSIKSVSSKINEKHFTSDLFYRESHDDEEPGSLREHVGNVHSLPTRQDDKAGNVTQGISEVNLNVELPAEFFNSANESKKLTSYKMDGPRRGFCLVINNVKFDGVLGERRGSCKDAGELERVFTWLGLEVKIYEDQTSKEIKDLMETWQNSKNHINSDCFICCILSHGDSGAIYGKDGELISIRTIMSYFTAKQCPALAEKPKLFFIQACQGKKIQCPVYVEADAQVPELPSVQQRISPSESIPEEADFLLGMATIDGYASFRHVDQGTWYIQALCSKLQLLVPRGEDILSILTEVNEDVSRRADSFGRKKQMPQPAYTLRKKFIFPVPRDPPPSQQH